MTALPAEPTDRFHDSQGLRLHYVDWGNATAPPLILIHGGRDHCRSWDAVARALQPHFRVIAPDLRGHGDSDWAKGSSYSLADHVYDLSRLVRAAVADHPVVVGHSMGGMVSLVYTGTFPEKVSRLVVLDGITVQPGSVPTPIDKQIARWVTQLDGLATNTPRRLASLTEAAERMVAHNKRLTPELALHLASFGTKQNADGSYRWKFDDYQIARAPYRLSSDDHIALWSRIACPTLLLRGDESFLPDLAALGALAHFKQAEFVTIAGAGHWLQHDRFDEVMASLRGFLGITD